MIKYFKYEHLPPGGKHYVAKQYYEMAHIIISLTPGPESTVALRKLMESRDAAFRAMEE